MSQLRVKYRTVDVILIDDIQFLVGANRTKEEFFLQANHEGGIKLSWYRSRSASFALMDQSAEAIPRTIVKRHQDFPISRHENSHPQPASITPFGSRIR